MLIPSIAALRAPSTGLAARAPPIVLANNVHVTSLLDALASSAFTPFPAIAAEALAELEKVDKSDRLDGLDVDPTGRWAILSFDSLCARLSELSTPVIAEEACGHVEISDRGPMAFQNDCCMTMSVQPSGDAADVVLLSCRGVVALDESDASVVFLAAKMSTPLGASMPSTEQSMDLVQAALEPQLPPGAIRARLELVWIDEDVCVLRESTGGVVVLQRVPTDDGPASGGSEVGDAPPEEVGEEDEEDDEDDEAGVRELWVGSPF